MNIITELQYKDNVFNSEESMIIISESGAQHKPLISGHLYTLKNQSIFNLIILHKYLLPT